MTDAVHPTTFCENCGRPLPDDRPGEGRAPCRDCGSTVRRHGMESDDAIRLSGRATPEVTRAGDATKP